MASAGPNEAWAGPPLKVSAPSKDDSIDVTANLNFAYGGSTLPFTSPFEGSGSLGAWLVRIAENEIRDQAEHHGRKRRDAGREVPLDDAASALAANLRSQTSRLVLDEKMQRLERALESLDDGHREVILLRRFEELSFKEIGERLGKSPDACRMLLARAMTALTLRMRVGP